MIIRHYRVLHTLHEPPRQRLSAAGRFWAVYLCLGIFLGLRIARRKRKERDASRVHGPGMPTEEAEEMDELRKRGWL